MNEITKKTVEALKANNMNAIYAESKQDVCEAVRNILFPDCSIAVGGSVTLSECGVRDIISEPQYRFFDRNRPGITPEERTEVYRKTVGCDFLLCSSNAITENGELVNVDGTGNRVSALAFGPKKIIVIAGVNKIVPDLPAAMLRIKRIAAPKNAVRLGLNTPCAKLGHCISLEGCDAPAFTAGCKSERRICALYLITGYQMDPERITVILCGETLGY